LESIAENEDSDDWEELRSPEGTPYYHNKITKEVKWEKPGSSKDKPGHRRTPSADRPPAKDLRKSDKRPEKSAEGRLSALEDRMSAIEASQAEQKKLLEQILAKLQSA
jgi:hypothetical protein